MSSRTLPFLPLIVLHYEGRGYAFRSIRPPRDSSTLVNTSRNGLSVLAATSAQRTDFGGA